jgi:TRAP transporter TAXI family solute receptor
LSETCGVSGWWRRPRSLAVGAGGLAALVAATVALVAGWGGDQAVRPVQIRIATGSPGAVYYKYGRAYADIVNRELPGVHATVLVTTASVTNVQMVRDGQAEVAFAQADILSEDLHTAGLAALARVYDDQLHLVVRAAGPIQSVRDLAGRRVSTGAAGSGTFITAERLLRLAALYPGGIQERRLGLDASVAALKAGEIDAFFFSGGLPVAAIAQLAGQAEIRLVGLGAWVAQMRRAYTDVYDERAVPASVYGLPPISTIGDPNYLVVSPRQPERIAYDLTRVLIKRRAELGHAHPAAEWLDSRTAIHTVPLDLHPGAVRYYRDAKE